MMLTHICPKCKKEHQCDSTPEPDKLCPLCDQDENGCMAEVRIVFRTGNCPMRKEEGQWLENMIIQECAKMHITLEKVEWYGLD